MSIRRTRWTLRRTGGWLCCCLWLASCGETDDDDDDDASVSNTTNTTNGGGNGGSNGGSGGDASTTGTGGASTAGSAAAGGSGGGGADTGGSSTGGADTGGTTGTGGSSTGGTTSTDGADTGGTAGTGGTASTGGTAGTGGASTGGTAGTGGASTGGTAGTGGASTGGTAGTGGSNDCSGAYEGPVGGPREGGPALIDTACDQIDDDVIVARYDDDNLKVPQGLYWESADVSYWGESCSENFAETLDRASEQPIGDVEDQVLSDWSYEVVGCNDGSRRFYSDLRCSYFDGTTLDGSSVEDLAYLASLLWWMDNGNLGGAQILGYTASVGSATDSMTMCTIRTTYGDFGVCDRITLQQTTHSITVAGIVTLGEPETVRTIQGTCN